MSYRVFLPLAALLAIMLFVAGNHEKRLARLEATGIQNAPVVDLAPIRMPETVPFSIPSRCGIEVTCSGTVQIGEPK